MKIISHVVGYVVTSSGRVEFIVIDLTNNNNSNLFYCNCTYNSKIKCMSFTRAKKIQ